MIIPVGAPNFAEALRMGAEIFHQLKALLKKRGLVTAVGDEGGFAPNLGSNEEALETILEAARLAGYKPGKDIFLAIDAAASEFSPKAGVYELKAEKKSRRDAAEMVAYYAALAKKYPIDLDRGRPRRGRLEGLEGAHGRARRRRSRSSATTSS